MYDRDLIKNELINTQIHYSHTLQLHKQPDLAVPPFPDFTAPATLSTVCVKQSRAVPRGEKDTLKALSALCTMSMRD
jgi:hypothetical protein